MLHIYTGAFNLWPRLKNLVKKVLRRQAGGPDAVVESLVLGLTELGVPFILNQPPTDPNSQAVVLNGHRALAWAVNQKRQGRIKKLLAGPNVVLTPFDYGRLILLPEIDTYLVPADWSKQWWSRLVPEFGKKIAVWPAGVKDRGVLVNPKGRLLIFYKSGDYGLAEAAFALGHKLALNPLIIRYGKFSQEQYFDWLKTAKFMVYIGQSESQGLALHEAWMAGVPTLIYGGGELRLKGYKFQTPNIDAPYLTEECGWFFSSVKDLEAKLPAFNGYFNNLRPREYSLNNFTNKISAQKFLNILNA